SIHYTTTLILIISPLFTPSHTSLLFPYTTLFRSQTVKRIYTILRLNFQETVYYPGNWYIKSGIMAFNISSLSYIIILQPGRINRSEEHTSEIQSRFDLVCSHRL